MEKTIGVDEARTKLGRLAEELGSEADSIVLTRRGRRVAVLVSPGEYDSLLEARRQAAKESLQSRLAEVRATVAAAGLDVSVVDEAISAARSVG